MPATRRSTTGEHDAVRRRRREADEIAAIAEEILPNSRSEVIERDYGQEDMRVVEKCRREAMEVSMPQFLVGFKCPPAADGAALMRQDIIADIACDILLGRFLAALPAALR